MNEPEESVGENKMNEPEEGNEPTDSCEADKLVGKKPIDNRGQ